MGIRIVNADKCVDETNNMNCDCISLSHFLNFVASTLNIVCQVNAYYTDSIHANYFVHKKTSSLSIDKPSEKYDSTHATLYQRQQFSNKENLSCEYQTNISSMYGIFSPDPITHRTTYALTLRNHE